MNKAKPSDADPTRCVNCGQTIFLTMTARGQEFAHRDSKMLFCTNRRITVYEDPHAPGQWVAHYGSGDLEPGERHGTGPNPTSAVLDLRG